MIYGDVNTSTVLGNITAKPELKTTSSGKEVTEFSIATNHSFKVGEEWKKKATFHTIVVWGNDAKYLCERADKGDKVYAQGRLEVQEWEKDGQKKSKHVIVAYSVILLTKKENKPSVTPSTEDVPADMYY
jgi:single-strand DNA-binding protein